MSSQYITINVGATAYRKASYDPSITAISTSIHISAFSCSGLESSITDCRYSNITYNSFTHANDAGIKCCK